eukprot:835282-Prymnesium_polylepis.1
MYDCAMRRGQLPHANHVLLSCAPVVRNKHGKLRALGVLSEGVESQTTRDATNISLEQLLQELVAKLRMRWMQVLFCCERVKSECKCPHGIVREFPPDAWLAVCDCSAT